MELPPNEDPGPGNRPLGALALVHQQTSLLLFSLISHLFSLFSDLFLMCRFLLLMSYFLLFLCFLRTYYLFDIEWLIIAKPTEEADNGEAARYPARNRGFEWPSVVPVVESRFP
jgi:hypothetical protein